MFVNVGKYLLNVLEVFTADIGPLIGVAVIPEKGDQKQIQKGADGQGVLLLLGAQFVCDFLNQKSRSAAYCGRNPIGKIGMVGKAKIDIHGGLAVRAVSAQICRFKVQIGNLQAICADISDTVKLIA